MMKEYDPNDPNSVMPTRDDMSTLRKGTSWENEAMGDITSMGAGAASQLIGAFDKDPGYGNADIAQETLKYTAMGAKAGPIGAAVGTAVGLGVGIVKKKKYQKEKKKAEEKAEREENLSEYQKIKSEDYAGYQHGGEVFMKKYGPVSNVAGPQTKPEVMQAAAKKLENFNFMPDISARTDQTNIGIDYSRRGADMKKWFMDKWNLDEEGLKKVDFHTKDGSVRQYSVGGMTQGAYNHTTNPLAVVDKNGNHTGMELTGGEGVFDKPAMDNIKKLLRGGRFDEVGEFVNREMKTWKHK